MGNTPGTPTTAMPSLTLAPQIRDDENRRND